MVLADSDIMIEYFRSRDSELARKIDTMDIALCGVVRAEILQTMRSNGFQVPFADAVIAFIAMKYDIPLWTRDTHFLLIQGYYPELKLYESI